MIDKIIITAPIPPPLHGMSFATFMLIEGLSHDFTSVVIDTVMDKENIVVKQPSVWSPRRFFKIVARLLFDSSLMFKVNYEIHYLCTGMNFRGIVRYLPYVIISRIKCKPYVIHVHNAAFRKMYDTLSGFRKKVINFMFCNAAGVIVLGDSLKAMFEGVVTVDRLFVVENCVDDEYIASISMINKKKQDTRKGKCKILYLSNLMEEKGVLDLMDAVACIDNCELHLAGAIEKNEDTKMKVNRMLLKYDYKFFYHGIVAGDVKNRLLRSSDIFVLPSRNEGQPISILEAYANGLAVVTDPKCGGISDIFEDGVNGIACESGDVNSIKVAIERCMEQVNDFIEPNYKYAISKFKRSDFVNRVEAVIKKIVHL